MMISSTVKETSKMLVTSMQAQQGQKISASIYFCSGPSFSTLSFFGSDIFLNNLAFVFTSPEWASSPFMVTSE